MLHPKTCFENLNSRRQVAYEEVTCGIQVHLVTTKSIRLKVSTQNVFLLDSTFPMIFEMNKFRCAIIP